MARYSTKTVLMMVVALVFSTLAMAPSAAVAQPGRVAAKAPSVPLAAPVTHVLRPEAPPLPPVLGDGEGGLLGPGGPPLTGQLQRPEPGPDLSSETTTATSRHRVERDGQGSAEIYLEPTFRKKAGRWVEVDSTLRRSASVVAPVVADGALRPVRFGSSARRILELGLDKGPLTLSSPGLKLSRPALEGDAVVYRDVATDTDLRYVVGDDGVKEELVLASPAAPRSFTFHLADPSGGLGALTPDGAGGFAFANPVEEGVALTLPPALAWEQRGEASR